VATDLTDHFQHSYTHASSKHPLRIPERYQRSTRKKLKEVVISFGFTAHHCQHCQHCHTLFPLSLLSPLSSLSSPLANRCHYFQLHFHSIQLAFVEAGERITQTQHEGRNNFPEIPLSPSCPLSSLTRLPLSPCHTHTSPLPPLSARR
jgi:hypothetical protein